MFVFQARTEVSKFSGKLNKTDDPAEAAATSESDLEESEDEGQFTSLTRQRPLSAKSKARKARMAKRAKVTRWARLFKANKRVPKSSQKRDALKRRTRYGHYQV